MKKLSGQIIVFFVLTQLFAWLGLYLKQVQGIEGAELIFLCMPLFAAMVLHRLNPHINFFKSLRQFSFPAERGWYLFAFAVYPLGYLLITGLGLAFGLISTSGWQSYLLFVAIAFPSAFLFACFEELTWRGWLEPNLAAEGHSPFFASLITGVIWVLWHLPLFVFAYYEIYTYRPVLSFTIFSLTLLIDAQIYGLMRRRSKTVWTSVLMHSSANAFAFPLIVGDAAIWTSYSMPWLILPTPSSIISLIIWSGIAVILFRRPDPEKPVLANPLLAREQRA